LDRQASCGLGFEYVKGETAIQEADGKHGFTVRELEDCLDKFLLGTENTLRGKVVKVGHQRSVNVVEGIAFILVEE